MIDTNCIGISTKDTSRTNRLGAVRGVYPILSLLSHSCITNCRYIIMKKDPHTAEIRLVLLYNNKILSSRFRVLCNYFIIPNCILLGQRYWSKKERCLPFLICRRIIKQRNDRRNYELAGISTAPARDVLMQLNPVLWRRPLNAMIVKKTTITDHSMILVSNINPQHILSLFIYNHIWILHYCYGNLKIFYRTFLTSGRSLAARLLLMDMQNVSILW